MIKRKLYLNKIKPFMNKDVIKVLTGVRRCGKSTVLKQIIGELHHNGVKKEDIILINLEERKYLNIKNINQLDDLITKQLKNNNNRKYLLLDEIQNIKGWERLINAYLAENIFDIYITGSNANLLSGELATYISGRYIEIKIYPFSFKEFLEYKKENKNLKYEIRKERNSFNNNIKNLFYEYIKYGAMPSILKYNDDEKIEILEDIYNSVILKDIVKRNDVRDIELLDRIILYIMANIGRLFSANSIVKYLKKDQVNLSTNTIYNYLKYMEEACLIKKVKREDLVGKRVLNYIEKFFLVDLGFRQMLYGNNQEDIGQVLENIVYNELIRRGYKVRIGKLKDKEVDFVCRKTEKIIYIQVSYILAEESTVKREFEPLLKINNNFPKYVLSLDEFDRSHKGIKHLNIIDFLLGNEI